MSNRLDFKSADGKISSLVTSGNIENIIITVPNRTIVAATKQDITDKLDILRPNAVANIRNISKPEADTVLLDGARVNVIRVKPLLGLNNFIGKHVSTDWLFSKDSNFSTIALSSVGDTTHLITFPFRLLEANTTYYVKVKFNSDNYTSDWSDVFSTHTLETYIEEPTLSILDEAIITVNPTLVLSDFITHGMGINYTTTYIEIALDANFEYQVYNAEPTVLATQHTVTATLEKGKLYYTRVKYVGDTAISDWSDTLVFTPSIKSAIPIVTSALSALENTIIPVTISNYNSQHTYDIKVSGGSYTFSNGIIQWLLPTVAVNTEYKVFVRTIDTMNDLEPSDLVVHNITAINTPEVVDQSLVYNLTNISTTFTAVNHSPSKTLTSATVVQDATDTAFVGINNGTMREMVTDIIDHSVISIAGEVAYTDGVIIPKVGDHVCDTDNVLATITEVNLTTHSFKTVPELRTEGNFIFMLSSASINNTLLEPSSVMYESGAVIARFKPLTLTETRELVTKIEIADINTLTLFTAAVSKKA